MPTRIHKAFDGFLAKAESEHGAAMEHHVLGSPHHEFHKAMKQHCADGREAIQKAQIADSLEKARKDTAERDHAVAIRPPGLSAVAPTAPAFRAVPRYGQRSVEKPNVDPIFQKIGRRR